MKKSILIIILVLISSLVVFPMFVYAATPKFIIHILNNLSPGFNYSINSPVIIDYDGDGDQDIIIISKEGTIYILENITNEK